MIISHIFVLFLLSVVILYLNKMWSDDNELEDNLDFGLQVIFLGGGVLTLTVLNILGVLSISGMLILSPVVLLVSLNAVTDWKGHFIFDISNIIMYILMICLIIFNFCTVPCYWIIFPFPLVILLVSIIANKFGVMASGDVPLLPLLAVVLPMDSYALFLGIVGICSIIIITFMFVRSKVMKVSTDHNPVLEVNTIDDNSGFVERGSFRFPLYPLVWVSMLITISLIGVI